MVYLNNASISKLDKVCGLIMCFLVGW
jgi:hypothetical protein